MKGGEQRFRATQRRYRAVRCIFWHSSAPMNRRLHCTDEVGSFPAGDSKEGQSSILRYSSLDNVHFSRCTMLPERLCSGVQSNEIAFGCHDRRCMSWLSLYQQVLQHWCYHRIADDVNRYQVGSDTRTRTGSYPFTWVTWLSSSTP